MRTRFRFFDRLAVVGPYECLRAFVTVKHRKLGQWRHELGREGRLGDPIRHRQTGRSAEQSKAIRRFLGRLSGISGKRFTCMMAVLAARRLLDRRAVDATVFIGIRFADDPDAANGRAFQAHSWIVHGSIIVAGEGDLDSYRVIQRFD